MDSVYITIRVNSNGYRIELIGANGFPIDEQMLNLSLIDAAERGAYEVARKARTLRAIAHKYSPSTNEDVQTYLELNKERDPNGKKAKKRRREWYDFMAENRVE